MNYHLFLCKNPNVRWKDNGDEYSPNCQIIFRSLNEFWVESKINYTLRRRKLNFVITSKILRGVLDTTLRRGRDSIVVKFTTTYICNQCLSPLMLWVQIFIRARCTTLCNKICQWLAACRRFSTNKTDRHGIIEILLKVALNTITLTKKIYGSHDELFDKIFQTYSVVS